MLAIPIALFAALAAAAPTRELEIRANANAYAPSTTSCPASATPLVREATSINSEEAEYVKQRKCKADSALAAWLAKQGDFNTTNLPVVGLASSGGGLRALLVTAGVVKAFDGREEGEEAVGGIYQSLTYESGLSGKCVASDDRLRLLTRISYVQVVHGFYPRWRGMIGLLYHISRRICGKMDLRTVFYFLRTFCLKRGLLNTRISSLKSEKYLISSKSLFTNTSPRSLPKRKQVLTPQLSTPGEDFFPTLSSKAQMEAWPNAFQISPLTPTSQTMTSLSPL